MERFIDVVLLVFRAADENDAATVTFSAFRDAGDAPSFHGMIIFHSDRYGILSAYNTLFLNGLYRNPSCMIIT